MPTTLTDRHHQNRSWPVIKHTSRRRRRRNPRPLPKTHDKPVEPVVSHNSSESVNNQTRVYLQL